MNFPPLFYENNQAEKNKSLITIFFKENGFIINTAINWYFIDNKKAYHNFTQIDKHYHLLFLYEPNKIYCNLNILSVIKHIDEINFLDILFGSNLLKDISVVLPFN